MPAKKDTAKYFGGHLKHPLKSGGLFSTGGDTKTGIEGTLKLFDDRIEFENFALRRSKKWKIVIPFDRIDVDSIEFVEKDSGRATAVGSGVGAIGPVGLGVGIGGGFISKVGNMNLLTIPYIDENGIKHAPMFQIKGLVRDKTQEWAEALYDIIVELKKRKTQDASEIAKTGKAERVDEDITEKLKKLKELYDMGILSEEEFSQKKRDLLDKL